MADRTKGCAPSAICPRRDLLEAPSDTEAQARFTPDRTLRAELRRYVTEFLRPRHCLAETTGSSSGGQVGLVGCWRLGEEIGSLASGVSYWGNAEAGADAVDLGGELAGFADRFVGVMAAGAVASRGA